jgi:hypothetical protein
MVDENRITDAAQNALGKVEESFQSDRSLARTKRGPRA